MCTKAEARLALIFSVFFLGQNFLPGLWSQSLWKRRISPQQAPGSGARSIGESRWQTWQRSEWGRHISLGTMILRCLWHIVGSAPLPVIVHQSDGGELIILFPRHVIITGPRETLTMFVDFYSHSQRNHLLLDTAKFSQVWLCILNFEHLYRSQPVCYCFGPSTNF